MSILGGVDGQIVFRRGKPAKGLTKKEKNKMKNKQIKKHVRGRRSSGLTKSSFSFSSSSSWGSGGIAALNLG